MRMQRVGDYFSDSCSSVLEVQGAHECTLAEDGGWSYTNRPVIASACLCTFAAA